MHTILQLPFSIFLMRNSFEAIPREIEEAAMIDGCSTWQRFTRIFLPLAVPGAGDGRAVRVHQFLERVPRRAHFHEPGDLVHRADPAGQRADRQFGAVDWGALQASVIISIIPCLAVYLALQRYYISGLLSGAVK